MPRDLSTAMNDRQLSDVRQRAWRIDVYDLASLAPGSEQDIVDVIAGRADATIFDATSIIDSVDIVERGSDAANGILSANSITLTVLDRGSVYDPVEGSSPTVFQRGNVVRIREGYTDVPIDEWSRTFTGSIDGVPGRSAPDDQGNSILTVIAADRMAEFLAQVVTSNEFAQGTTYAAIMQDIIEVDMGIPVDQYDLAGIGTEVTGFASTQFVDQSPMKSLADLAFSAGFVPRFDGAGVLRFSQFVIEKGDARVYADNRFIEGVARPAVPQRAPTRVEVKGLESRMSRVFQTPGVVAEVSVTLGFFSNDANVDVGFSDDGRLWINNPILRVRQSVQGALVGFGGESLSVDVEDTDPSDGTIQGSLRGQVRVVSALNNALQPTLMAIQILSALIPDLVVTIGFIGSGGWTISLGRIIENAATIGVQLALATIGRGQYEVHGTPYEYVFRELRGVAEVSTAKPNDQPIVIENQLIDTQAQVDVVALRELKIARGRFRPRSITMRTDLRLEPDDRFSIQGGRAFYITSITRRLERDQEDMATFEAFDVTAGATL